MTARAAFKQEDVTRACKGVAAAGLQVGKVVVRAGEIIIIPGPVSDGNQPVANPWKDNAEEEV